MENINQALEIGQLTKGMRPCKRGLRFKLAWEEIVTTLDLKAVAVEDLGEEVTWPTGDNQEVYVDYEFFVAVVPELAVRNYAQRLAGGGDMQKILDYCRGATETFQQSQINLRKMDELRRDPAEFDCAFKNFVVTDQALKETMIRLGVRISNPSVFGIKLKEEVKEALLAKQQTAREQDAVAVIKRRNRDLSQMEANQIHLAQNGKANITFDMRTENRNEKIEVSGLPAGLLNYNHVTGGSGRSSGKNQGKQGGQGGQQNKK